MMAGGEELEALGHELEEFARTDQQAGAKLLDTGREFEAEAATLQSPETTGAEPRH
jgi:hypothetical protein